MAIESYSSNKGDKNLSKALYKEQKAIAINKYAPKMLNKNRKEIKWTKHFNISANCDTIFMLEAYDLHLESGILRSYGTLWNSKGDEFSYERINNKKVMEVRDKEYFA